jgi:hypothetical protein
MLTFYEQLQPLNSNTITNRSYLKGVINKNEKKKFDTSSVTWLADERTSRNSELVLTALRFKIDSQIMPVILAACTGKSFLATGYTISPILSLSKSICEVKQENCE